MSEANTCGGTGCHRGCAEACGHCDNDSCHCPDCQEERAGWTRPVDPRHINDLSDETWRELAGRAIDAYADRLRKMEQ